VCSRREGRGRHLCPRGGVINRKLVKITDGELRNSYCSTNTTQIIKSRRARWAGNVARMGDRIGAYRFMVGGNLKVGFVLENIGIDECIILKRMFKKYDEGYGLRSSVTKQGPVASTYEPLYPVRRGEFVEQVTNSILASEEGLSSMEKDV